MPTLFKRSNGIYYAILSDKPGRRKWVSTGERRRNLALKKISILRPEPSQETKTLKIGESYREFIEFAETVYSKETDGIYKRAFNNFITIVGDIPIHGMWICSEAAGSPRFGRVEDFHSLLPVIESVLWEFQN